MVQGKRAPRSQHVLRNFDALLVFLSCFFSEQMQAHGRFDIALARCHSLAKSRPAHVRVEDKNVLVELDDLLGYLGRAVYRLLVIGGDPED
jgi:hypothetical protein